MKAVGGGDQLHRDAQLVAGAAHAAFQHLRDAERAADLAQVFVAVLEIERRRAPRDLHARNVREVVDQLLSEPVSEIVAVGVVAETGERQYRDRVRGGRRNGRVGGGGGCGGRCGCRRRDAFTQLRKRDADCDHDGDQQRRLDPAAAHRAVESGSDDGAADAVRRDFERPRDDRGDRQADQQQHRDERDRPWRQRQRREQFVDDLQHAPRDHRIGAHDAQYLAALQFGEKRLEHERACGFDRPICRIPPPHVTCVRSGNLCGIDEPVATPAGVHQPGSCGGDFADVGRVRGSGGGAPAVEPAA